MPNSPKETEEKLDRIVNAWRAHAPDKIFGGMTLAQFQTEITPSRTVRVQLADNDNQRTSLLNQRDDADDHSLDKAQLMVAGVIGDPNFGQNSTLYEAIGYVRKSERKTGLTRKKGDKTPATPKTN